MSGGPDPRTEGGKEARGRGHSARALRQPAPGEASGCFFYKINEQRKKDKCQQQSHRQNNLSSGGGDGSSTSERPTCDGPGFRFPRLSPGASAGPHGLGGDRKRPGQRRDHQPTERDGRDPVGAWAELAVLTAGRQRNHRGKCDHPPPGTTGAQTAESSEIIVIPVHSSQRPGKAQMSAEG